MTYEVTRKLAENNRQEWVLAVMEASHNHDASENFAAFSEVRLRSKSWRVWVYQNVGVGIPAALI
ncbi:hypothetical protein OnM2_080061 [Erysiphe neolycopersici]|uniref:Uncharacterized protein n=1 Tax=Erysiphe neolycopersici TaxID=212602 RepID=A0A420HGV8_9PEZI|nr:hypothetical protein OnM2_080061 [Erysiphe neolycopersici]